MLRLQPMNTACLCLRVDGEGRHAVNGSDTSACKLLSTQHPSYRHTHAHSHTHTHTHKHLTLIAFARHQRVHQRRPRLPRWLHLLKHRRQLHMQLRVWLSPRRRMLWLVHTLRHKHRHTHACMHTRATLLHPTCHHLTTHCATCVARAQLRRHPAACLCHSRRSPSASLARGPAPFQSTRSVTHAAHTTVTKATHMHLCLCMCD